MKRISAVALLFASATSLACECRFDGLDLDAAWDSDVAVLFQVISARLDTSSQRVAIAEVKLVHSIRGENERFREVRYSVSNCCGTHLDVGHHYVGFFDDSESVPFVHPGNLFMLWADAFDPADPLAAVAHVEAELLGGKSLQGGWLRYSNRHLGGLMCKPSDGSPHP